MTLGEDVHDISAASVDVSRPQAAAVERSAGDGDADSKYFLGLLALYGKGGVERDPAKAVGAFRGAAERGHLEAATATGMLLRHGLGVARDDRAALQWFAAAAQKGHAHGMFMYGLVLAEGRGVLAPDATAAREWLSKAAEAGCVEAMHELGALYEYASLSSQQVSSVGASTTPPPAASHPSAVPSPCIPWRPIAWRHAKASAPR